MSEQIVLEPDDLSFLRRGAEGGLGSDRAHTLPSDLMRADAVYNFTRRIPGLASERTPGPFTFFDADGRGAPYVLWRRTQSLAIVPHSRSLDDAVWSPDVGAVPVPANEMDEGIKMQIPRILGINSDSIKDWIKVAREASPLGVDLVMSLGDVELKENELLNLVSNILARDGDLVVGGDLVSENLANRLSRRFEGVYLGESLMVAVTHSPGKRRASQVQELVDIIDLGADDEDPLRVWLACDA